jgi:hypothetical protein
MPTYDYRKTKIELPVFHWTVEVVITSQVLKYARHVGWRGSKGEETTRGINMFFDEDLTTAIVIQPDATAGTIAHEAWHSVYRMLTHMGAALDNETVAYHLGYLVEAITQFKRKPKKKKVDKKSNP